MFTQRKYGRGWTLLLTAVIIAVVAAGWLIGCSDKSLGEVLASAGHEEAAGKSDSGNVKPGDSGNNTGGNNNNGGNNNSLCSLTINVSPPGVATVSRMPDKMNYKYGDTVTVMTWLAPGYGNEFVGWFSDTTLISTSNPLRIIMNGNKTLTANFQQQTTTTYYTLTTSVSPAGGGSVSVYPDSVSYASGMNVMVTATPSSGYTFTGWSGASTSTNSSVTITMNGDKTLTANFEQQTTTTYYTLTTSVSPTGGGSVSVNPSGGSYTSGTNVTVTATPSSGYTFTGWSGASTSTSTAVTVTMDGDKTLTANFQQQTMYTLTTSVSPMGGGSVSRSPNQTNYTSGTNVTVTATAADGYVFTGWSGASTSTSTAVTITMDGNKTLTANFIGTFSDSRDNKTYKIVKIGNQTWMAENLNYQPEIGNSWCYDDDESMCNTYGRLYDWETAMTICPAGWKLPDTADWRKLVTSAGSKSVAGEVLKSKFGWNQNGNGTDILGFSALPGGYRGSVSGGFYGAGDYGYWWTATTSNDSFNFAHIRIMDYSYDYVDEDARYTYHKSGGYSVRCVNDW